MTWSKDVRACKTLWTSLIALDQMSENVLFADAGAKLMKDLTFFAANTGAGTLEARANGMAFDLDRTFQSVRGARFESGVTHIEAINAMTAVLKQADDTVEDLADVADAQYRFVEE